MLAAIWIVNAIFSTSDDQDPIAKKYDLICDQSCFEVFCYIACFEAFVRNNRLVERRSQHLS